MIELPMRQETVTGVKDNRSHHAADTYLQGGFYPENHEEDKEPSRCQHAQKGTVDRHNQHQNAASFEISHNCADAPERKKEKQDPDEHVDVLQIKDLLHFDTPLSNLLSHLDKADHVNEMPNKE